MPVATANQQLRDRLKQVRGAIDEARQERAEKVQERDAAKDAFTQADVPLGSVDAPEFKAVQDAVGAVGAVDDRLEQLRADERAILSTLGENLPGPDEHGNGPQDTADRAAGDAWNSRALFGAETSDRLKTVANSKARFGSIELGQVASRDGVMRMLAAEVAGTTNMRRGAFGGIVPQMRRRLTVLDLIPAGTMDENTFPYVQEVSTYLAAETAEGSAKPEAGFDLVDAEAAAQTIAHYKKIRKQALADSAALQSAIDSHLRYGVLRRLENQVLAGDGTGSNLRGILNTTGIASVPFAAGSPLADLLLSGVTQVFLGEGEADGIVLNPVDWQTVLTAKASGTDGATGITGSYEYLAGDPFGAVAQVLWGVPLLPSAAIAQGTALVGDFAMGAQLLIREGVQVLISDSDQDDFIKNRVTMLGEMRAALPVWRPVGFAEVALEA